MILLLGVAMKGGAGVHGIDQLTIVVRRCGNLVLRLADMNNRKGRHGSPVAMIHIMAGVPCTMPMVLQGVRTPGIPR